MKPRLSEECARKIRTEVPVEIIVGRDVPLRWDGDRYRGPSPFTAGRTELEVRPADNRFNGPATGNYGNPIDWLRKRRHMHPRSAMEALADEFGIELEFEDVRVTDHRDRKRAVAEFFADCRALGLRDAS